MVRSKHLFGHNGFSGKLSALLGTGDQSIFSEQVILMKKSGLFGATDSDEVVHGLLEMRDTDEVVQSSHTDEVVQSSRNKGY